jgi:peptidoglycan hydrolase-like protein with peptidoglycan-binding domain
MNKNITKLIAIATIVLIPVVSFAQSTTPSSSPSSTPAPVSSPASSPASASASQPTSGTSLSAGNSTAGTAPSAGGSTAGTAPSAGASTAGTAPSAGGSTAGVTPTVGQSTAGTSAPTTPTPTPTPANSSSSSGPYSSSSGSRVNYSYMYGCPMITSFMKYGANNDTVQVTKLQNFLKNVEKIDVDVNGIFDKRTESAVIAFQNKYNPTIMGPWGATKGTGFVYITTVKQINKITCSLPLTLNASELTIINATRNARIASAKPVTIVPKETPASIEIEVSGTDNNTITFESETETIEENVATVGKASIMSRFWDFMVYLFK